jgi:hypothetical protein
MLFVILAAGSVNILFIFVYLRHVQQRAVRLSLLAHLLLNISVIVDDDTTRARFVRRSDTALVDPARVPPRSAIVPIRRSRHCLPAKDIAQIPWSPRVEDPYLHPSHILHLIVRTAQAEYLVEIHQASHT